jgi:hypothetical protein
MAFNDTKNHSGELHSLGRDGTLRRWRFSYNQIDVFKIRLISVCRLSFEWPCVFLNEGDRQMIAGFHSVIFYIRNFK